MAGSGALSLVLQIVLFPLSAFRSPGNVQAQEPDDRTQAARNYHRHSAERLRGQTLAAQKDSAESGHQISSGQRPFITCSPSQIRVAVVQVKRLSCWLDSGCARFSGVNTLFIRPGTLNEALEALAQTGGTILAGGTDLFPACSGRQLSGPVIDISRVTELKGVRFTEEFVEIGARTTWSEVLAAGLPRGFDGLCAAAREVGSIQIQNSATVAGNVCNASPAADGVAALMALDAEVTLESHAGARAISLADFVQGNRKTARQANEMMTSVRVPRRWENAVSSFLKLGARRYLVISIVMVAVNLTADSRGRVREAAVCVGSCSPKAMRLTELERALVGVPLGPQLRAIPTSSHFSRLAPIDDVRATAGYRLEAAQTLVLRALDECASKVA